MFPDPSVVLYACVSRVNHTTVTILTDFNPENDPDIESSSIQCLQNTPPHHSIFSHTNENRIYTYLIDKDIVFFCILNSEKYFDEPEQGTPLFFLNRVKQRFDNVIVKRKNNRAVLTDEYRGLQSAGDELFREPLGLRNVNSKGVKGVCVKFLGLAMCAVMKKRKKEKQSSSFRSSDAHSECALVGSIDMKRGT